MARARRWCRALSSLRSWPGRSSAPWRWWPAGSSEPWRAWAAAGIPPSAATAPSVRNSFETGVRILGSSSGGCALGGTVAAPRSRFQEDMGPTPAARPWAATSYDHRSRWPLRRNLGFSLQEDEFPAQKALPGGATRVRIGRGTRSRVRPFTPRPNAEIDLHRHRLPPRVDRGHRPDPATLPPLRGLLGAGGPGAERRAGPHAGLPGARAHARPSHHHGHAAITPARRPGRRAARLPARARPSAWRSAPAEPLRRPRPFPRKG